MMTFLRKIYYNLLDSGKSKTVINLIILIIIQIGASMSTVMTTDNLSVVDRNYIFNKTSYYLFDSMQSFIVLLIITHILYVIFCDKDDTYTMMINRLIFCSLPYVLDFAIAVIWLIFLKGDAFTITHYSKFVNFAGNELIRYNFLSAISIIFVILRFVVAVCVFIVFYRENTTSINKREEN